MGKHCKFKKSVMHPITGETAWEQGESYPVLYETDEGFTKLGEPITPAYWFGELAIEKQYEGIVFDVIEVEDTEPTEVGDEV